MKPRKILVGIDEPDDVDGVLEFAAAEAVRRQCGVHLMHALSVGSRHGDGSELTLSSDTLQHAGTDALVKGAQQLEELLHDELSVTTELVHDSAVSALNEASPHACLVLLQRRPKPGVAHGLRSVVNGVAAHAAAPVLVVPSSWRRSGERAPVVVGVGETEVSGSLVSAGLEMARRSGTGLRLVHARPDGQSSPEGAATSGRDAFAELLAEYPDVQVESRVHQGAPEDTLVAAGETASLVVIGRHHRRHRMGPRLGSTARAVLAQAPCPVMVVEPGDDGDSG
ncbi:MAG: universal stress protein [Nocardioides sp.]